MYTSSCADVLAAAAAAAALASHVDRCHQCCCCCCCCTCVGVWCFRSAPFTRRLTGLYTAATLDVGEKADKLGEWGPHRTENVRGWYATSHQMHAAAAAAPCYLTWRTWAAGPLVTCVYVSTLNEELNCCSRSMDVLLDISFESVLSYVNIYFCRYSLFVIYYYD